MDLPIIETALRPVPLEDREKITDAEINAQELFGTKEVRPPSALPVAVAMVDFHRAVAELAAPMNGGAALRLLASAEELEDGDRVRAFEALMDRYGDDRRAGVRRGGRQLPGLLPLRSAPSRGRPTARPRRRLDAAARGQDPAERREAIGVLGGLRGEACAEMFAAIGSDLEPTAPELVEWLAAAERHPSARVKAVFDARKAAMADSGDAITAWLMCLEGGDAERGRAIFTGKSETACLRCHVVGEEGGSRPAALDGVGGRLSREEILRSVVEPNAQIAAGYENWLISLDDGEVLSGRILEESEELVVVETSKKEVWEIPPGEIEARRRDVSAMPADVSTHLSRAEMRDLVAFLASLRD